MSFVGLKMLNNPTYWSSGAAGAGCLGQRSGQEDRGGLEQPKLLRRGLPAMAREAHGRERHQQRQGAFVACVNQLVLSGKKSPPVKDLKILTSATFLG